LPLFKKLIISASNWIGKGSIFLFSLERDSLKINRRRKKSSSEEAGKKGILKKGRAKKIMEEKRVCIRGGEEDKKR
jgi:hypothetical protein